MKSRAICCFLLCTIFSYADPLTSEQIELQAYYEACTAEPSDISEHLATLKLLSSECSSAVEIGVRPLVSSWAILAGLSESKDPERYYIGIDSELPHWDTLQRARELAESQQIHFQFWKTDELSTDINLTDLLFIDSIHTYCHLTAELDRFSSNIRKYIIIHDTSLPWGMEDDTAYQGDYSEYDKAIDRTKKGLWPAVVDFLAKHPEWVLHRYYANNHGLSVLKRIT